MIVTAGAVGLFLIGSSGPSFRADFDQLWWAGRAVLDGFAPAEYVGPGRQFDYGGPLYYPLPAVVATLPLALLPLVVARMIFVALATFLLAYGLCRTGLARLPLFLSGSFLMALAIGQWEILFTAALLLPAAGVIAAAKPNIALAILAGSHNVNFFRWAVVGGAVLVGISFLISPSWIPEWLASVAVYPRIPPLVSHTGGFLILLCLLRWRRPEARLVVAMALIPHTSLVYAALPVLLAARRLDESVLLALLSLVVLVVQRAIDPRGTLGTDPFEVFASYAADVGQLTVLFVFLPATAMILSRRNEHEPI